MSLYYKQDGFSHSARMTHTHHTRGDDHGQRACCAAPNEATLKDPVCGMTVTPQSPHHVSHARQRLLLLQRRLRVEVLCGSKEIS